MSKRFKEGFMNLSNSKNYTEALDEWIKVFSERRTDSNKVQCICGHDIYADVRYLINKENKKCIYVGSGCIKNINKEQFTSKYVTEAFKKIAETNQYTKIDNYEEYSNRVKTELLNILENEIQEINTLEKMETLLDEIQIIENILFGNNENETLCELIKNLKCKIQKEERDEAERMRLERERLKRQRSAREHLECIERERLKRERLYNEIDNINKKIENISNHSLQDLNVLIGILNDINNDIIKHPKFNDIKSKIDDEIKKKLEIKREHDKAERERAERENLKRRSQMFLQQGSYGIQEVYNTEHENKVRLIIGFRILAKHQQPDRYKKWYQQVIDSIENKKGYYEILEHFIDSF
tara:strand:+ start:13860 stop:14924 length:1065 start_codon:yes stop_codon:yes gene_type:complete